MDCSTCPSIIAITTLTTVGLLMSLMFWMLTGRWQVVYPKVDKPVVAPPSNLSALAVSLLKSRTVDEKTVSSMVLEMWQKGVLEQLPGEQI